jgi:hypothetical protein
MNIYAQLIVSDCIFLKIYVGRKMHIESMKTWGYIFHLQDGIAHVLGFNVQ